MVVLWGVSALCLLLRRLTAMLLRLRLSSCLASERSLLAERGSGAGREGLLELLLVYAGVTMQGLSLMTLQAA